MKSLILLGLFPVLLHAQTMLVPQTFPQQRIDNILQDAQTSYNSASYPVCNNSKHPIPSNPYQLIHTYKSGRIVVPKAPIKKTRGIDTLYVGATPKDTVVVTGIWQSNGPIYVLNDGVLIFKNAQATVLGNITAYNKGQIIAFHSTFYIPQQYFYQRTILTANDASIRMVDCSMNFGGLNHNFVLVDSSTIALRNVHFSDWTTTGMYGSPVFSIDSCNTLGEIIIEGNSNLSVKNTDTVLLWHQVPHNTQFTWTFPNGINVNKYSLTPKSTGLSGINYTIEADSCKLIWWALMPEDNSQVTISNSDIRAIGAWFTGKDSTTVSGLADNTTYTSSGNLFKDRILVLNNSTVTTWNLYPMDTSVVNIKSCIAGEIGSENTAKTTCTSIFLDGSGGYFWTSNSSLQLGLFSAFTSNVRSEGNSIMLIGYSSIANGTASSINNSILFLVQTSVLQQPVAYDGSETWVAQVLPPASAYVNDSFNIQGSAYITRGPSSQLMIFDHYNVKYQATGSNTWLPLTGNVMVAANQSTIAKWNTYGLTPGNYTLLLTLKDNLGDSVVAQASVNLLPAILSVGHIKDDMSVSVFPNPVSDDLTVNIPQAAFNTLIVTDITGRIVIQQSISNTADIEHISTSTFIPGMYIVKLVSPAYTTVKTFIKQ